MRRGVVVGILGGVVLALAASAGAVESRMLTRDQLAMEAKTSEALALCLKRNGYPDVAEMREHLDTVDWANETVVLYYLDAHKEMAFGKAHMFVADVGAQRLDRNMTDEEVAALSTQPSMRTVADDQLASLSKSDVAFGSGDPADRAEAAAFRAEQAAGKVEEAAVRTERAAARAEAVVDKMLAIYKR
jgi:uncharacterized protein (DUF2132 family)